MVSWCRKRKELAQNLIVVVMISFARNMAMGAKAPRHPRYPYTSSTSRHPHIPAFISPTSKESLTRLFASSHSIDLITSTKSGTVKKIQQLLTKRKRRLELSQTVVEGPRMVFDLLENPNTRPLVEQVIVSIDRPEWTEKLTQYAQQGVLICEGTPEVLGVCSDTVTPQGIVACVAIPDSEPKTIEGRQPVYLMLDGVSDPGNVGTLLRSSVAVGVSGVVLLPGCCDVWNPKAVRSAMGTSFLVPILSADSVEEAKGLLQVQEVYAATMEESGGSKSVPHFDIPFLDHRTALVIGSEGNGLSDEVRNSVSLGEIKAVHVPMEPGIESLNAAVCGSVVLFEYHRQCLQS